MNARDRSYEDGLILALTDPQEAAAYIDAVVEMGDPVALELALLQVVRADGVAEVARRAELGEKTLFRSLSETGNPTLETLQKVLHSVGLRLSVQPIEGPS